ncbi:MAG TPA: hypothetical protein DCQ35_11665, partial [Rhodospirillum rubrum]|nr:hypothetical protein [Rhodospirillum rubrum]
MTLFLHITGPNAQALAAEVEAFFAEVIGTPVERRSLPKDDVIYRSDPLAVAALVLAIPGALVATLDLAQRARLGAVSYTHL